MVTLLDNVIYDHGKSWYYLIECVYLYTFSHNYGIVAERKQERSRDASAINNRATVSVLSLVRHAHR